MNRTHGNEEPIDACVCVCDPSTRINIYTYMYFVVVHENRGTHVYRPIVSTV